MHRSVAHDNRMKFADFVPIYLDFAKLTMSESVYYRYEKMLQYSIIPELGDAYKNDSWVFTQSDGSPMYPTTPTQWFDRFQKYHNLLENILNKKAQKLA